MKEGLLYALAALGVVTLGRWILVAVAWVISDRTGLTRRFRRAIWRHDMELIASPEWQASFERDVRHLVEDFEDAMPSSWRAS
jgi:hypothetical protein